jgi:hypothetical protein
VAQLGEVVEQAGPVDVLAGASYVTGAIIAADGGRSAI